MVQILIPSFKQLQCKNDRYTVYCIEIYISGQCHKVDRRYSEFYELHRTLKKYFHQNQLPNLPPKKVRNQSSKVIEQRRICLEEYLKQLIQNIGLDEVHELKEFLDLIVDNKSSSNDKRIDQNQPKYLFKNPSINDHNDEDAQESRDFHQCMIGFKNDHLFSSDSDLTSFLRNNTDSFGVGSYSSSNSVESTSHTSTSSSASSLSNILVIGSMIAIYDKEF